MSFNVCNKNVVYLLSAEVIVSPPSLSLVFWFVLFRIEAFNPLNPELNPICYLLALLGAHHFLHVSKIRVKILTFRRLMSYIYMEHPFLMFLDHTMTQHSP